MTRYFTKREIKQLSSPAQHPRYTMTIPAGTECQTIGLPPTSYAVKDIGKVQGGNAHDLDHYYVWIDASEIEARRE